jgi:hypothetical protein
MQEIRARQNKKLDKGVASQNVQIKSQVEKRL